MVRKFPMEIPFRNCGEVLHNFRTEFPEIYLTIWFPTEICGFFGQMVSTHGVVSHRKFETCGNLRLCLANTCVYLRWLTITLIKLKFVGKLAHVSHRLATQRKSTQGGLSIIFTDMSARAQGCTEMALLWLASNLCLLAIPFGQGFILTSADTSPGPDTWMWSKGVHFREGWLYQLILWTFISAKLQPLCFAYRWGGRGGSWAHRATHGWRRSLLCYLFVIFDPIRPFWFEKYQD